jgi:predicted PurR-regulated permease PerM
MPQDRKSPDTADPSFNVPIDVRSVALAVIAVLAVVLTLHWAQAVFIPIMLAVFLRYALMPVVEWLRRRARIPVPLGAAFTVIVLFGGIGYGITLLHDQTLEVLDMLPRAAQKFQKAMRDNARDKPGAIEKLKEAAVEIDKAASSATSTAPAPPAPKADAQAPKVSSYLWMGTVSAIAGLGQAVVVIALVYFLLIAGDTFKRKLVRISGDTLAEKRVTVEILHEIDEQIQRFLLVQVGTSALLGVLSWLVFRLIGLDNAAFWGIVSGILHLIPYIGPTIANVIIAVVAYLGFSDLKPVLLVIGSSLVITTAIGLILVPWLTERVSRINAVTVFIALLFWGWLWGFWGLLLGVPIVMAIKAVCEHVEDLHPIAELLGYEPPKDVPPILQGEPSGNSGEPTTTHR